MAPSFSGSSALVNSDIPFTVYKFRTMYDSSKPLPGSHQEPRRP